MDRRFEQSPRDNNRHSYSRHAHLERSYRSERYSNQRPDDSSTKYPSLSDNVSTRRPDTSSTNHRDHYTSRSNSEFRNSTNGDKREKNDSKTPSSSRTSNSNTIIDKEEPNVLRYPSHIPEQIVLSYPCQATDPQPQPQQKKEQVVSFSLEEEEEQERLLKSKKQQPKMEENEAKEQESLEAWVMHTSDKGETYYYNKLTRESAWQLPTTATTVAISSEKQSTDCNEAVDGNKNSSKDVVIDIEEDDTKESDAWVMHKSDIGEPYYYNKLTRQSVWKLPIANSKDKDVKKANENEKPKGKEVRNERKSQEERPKQQSIDNSTGKSVTNDKQKEHFRKDNNSSRQRVTESVESRAKVTPSGLTPKAVVPDVTLSKASTVSSSRSNERGSGTVSNDNRTRNIIDNGSNARGKDRNDRKHGNNSKEAKVESTNHHYDIRPKEMTTTITRSNNSRSRSLVEQESHKRKRSKSPLPPHSRTRSYSYMRHSESRHFRRSRSPPPPPPPLPVRGYYHYFRSPSPPPLPLPPSPDRYYHHLRRYDDYVDRRLPPPPPWYYEEDGHLIRQERMRSRERYDMRGYNHMHSDDYYHRQRYHSRSPPPPPPRRRGRDY